METGTNFVPQNELDNSAFSDKKFSSLRGKFNKNISLLGEADQEKLRNFLMNQDETEQYRIKEYFAYVKRNLNFLGIPRTEDIKPDFYQQRMTHMLEEASDDDQLSGTNGQTVEDYKARSQYLDTLTPEQCLRNRAAVLYSLTDQFQDTDLIIQIDKSLGFESSQAIIDKCAEIIAVASSAHELLKDVMHTPEPATLGIEDAVKHRLLDHVYSLLKRVADDTEKISWQPWKIIAELSHAKAETIAFVKIFKALKETGQPVELEDFKKFSLDIEVAGQGTEQTSSKEIYKLADKNWSGHRLHDDVMNSLSESLSSPKSTFYLLKYDGEVLGFLRLDDMGNNKLHFASFNVNHEMHNSGIGTTFLTTIFKNQTEGKIVEAEADPLSPVTQRYIQDFGFVATKVITYGTNGECVFEIVKDDQNSSSYLSKRYSEPVVEREENESTRDILTYRYSLPQQSKNFLETSRTLLNGGEYVLTSYFRGARPATNGSNEVVAVFERRQDSNVAESMDKAA